MSQEQKKEVTVVVREDLMNDLVDRVEVYFAQRATQGVLGKLPRNDLFRGSWFEIYRAQRKQKQCS
jgi:hypothetical protein